MKTANLAQSWWRVSSSQQQWSEGRPALSHQYSGGKSWSGMWAWAVWRGTRRESRSESWRPPCCTVLFPAIMRIKSNYINEMVIKEFCCAFARFKKTHYRLVLGYEISRLLLRPIALRHTSKVNFLIIADSFICTQHSALCLPVASFCMLYLRIFYKIIITK